MPKKPDLAEILRNNPQVDPNQLKESMELLDELERRGVSGRGYQLAPPFEGRQAETVDSSSEIAPTGRF